MKNSFKLMLTSNSCEIFYMRIISCHAKIKRAVKNREFSWAYYLHYEKMYQAINLLTVNFEDFVKILHNEVYYLVDKILHRYFYIKHKNRVRERGIEPLSTDDINLRVLSFAIRDR